MNNCGIWLKSTYVLLLLVVTANADPVAIGGWFRTDTPPAEMGLYMGVYPDNPVDFGETCPSDGGPCSDNAVLGTLPKFFGVIDPNGLDAFEFRELEGAAADQKFIFADDFHFAIFGIAGARKHWPLYK